MNKLVSLNAFESISDNQMKEIIGGKLAPTSDPTAGGSISNYLGQAGITKRWTSDDSAGNLYGVTYDNH